MRSSCTITEAPAFSCVWQPGYSPASRLVVIGLHCCGDLTPTILRLFTRLPNAVGLVCVSCCYHAMQPAECGTSYPLLLIAAAIKLTGLASAALEGFRSYRTCPLSSTVSGVLRQVELPINEYVTDLATECAGRWADDGGASLQHNHITVAYRAILDDVLQPELDRMCPELLEPRLLFRRHALRSKACFASIDSYLEVASSRLQMYHTLHGDRVLAELPFNVRDYEPQLREYHALVAPDFPRLKAFLALALTLQPVLERLILLDRQLYLLEHGFECSLVPLFDPRISPRNMALISSTSSTADSHLMRTAPS